MRSVASLVLVVGILAVPSPASADPPVCGPPVASTTQPGYTVADPDCDVNGTPFVPVGGSSVWTGIADGAAYRIERPAAWNGELVLYAHGFRGLGTTVFVDNPSLRAHYLSRGFAWAASSYQTNGYDVGQGVRDTYPLIQRFKETTGQRARAVYMTGASMGGHVAAVAIEKHPSAFVGAMPVCGVLGDGELFDYFLDANVTAAALTGTAITFPAAPVDPSFQEVYRQQVALQVPLLGTGAGLTPLGRRWGDFVEQRSGGTRPGFDAAFAYWSALPAIPPLSSVPFLFGVYPGLSGGTANIADGNITSNRLTLYQGDDSAWLTRDELRLNRDVLRVDRTDRPSRDLSGVPRIDGRPRVPVLSMHTIGDLFVPFSMEQEYARRTALQGRGKLFVSRAVRALGHCEFTGPELAKGFDDLVSWVRTGHRPAGDAILDRRAVAAADFGCRFTMTDRASFGAPCPS